MPRGKSQKSRSGKACTEWHTVAVHRSVDAKTHAHNMLKVVRLLRSGHSLDQICSTYTLKLRRHPVEPLLSLSYDQRANFEHEVTRECRGLVLEDKTFNVIAMPFMKFFNAAEPLGKATNFDWATAKVYEKLDGSLMTLYWHKGRWIVASSRLPEANGMFKSAFWDAWKARGYTLPERRDRCYMFELTSPASRIVVAHEEADLRCIGARDLATLKEVEAEAVAEENGWRAARRFPQLKSLQAVETAAEKLNPAEAEGFVAVDAKWNRIKIKSPAYVAMHHLGAVPTAGGDRRSPHLRRRRLLQIALAAEGDEWLAYWPEFAREFEAIKVAIARLDPGLREEGDVKKIEAALGEVQVAIGATAEVPAAPSGKAKAKAPADAEHALLDAAMAQAKKERAMAAAVPRDGARGPRPQRRAAAQRQSVCGVWCGDALA